MSITFRKAVGFLIFKTGGTLAFVQKTSRLTNGTIPTLTMAVEWGWSKTNPAKGVKLLKGEAKRLRILDREELSRLIGVAAGYLKPILIAAASTDMRKSGLLALGGKASILVGLHQRRAFQER